MVAGHWDRGSRAIRVRTAIAYLASLARRTPYPYGERFWGRGGDGEIGCQRGQAEEVGMDGVSSDGRPYPPLHVDSERNSVSVNCGIYDNMNR